MTMSGYVTLTNKPTIDEIHERIEKERENGGIEMIACAVGLMLMRNNRLLQAVLELTRAKLKMDLHRSSLRDRALAVQTPRKAMLNCRSRAIRMAPCVAWSGGTSDFVIG